MKLRRVLVALSVGLFACIAHAAPVSVGSLSSNTDGSTQLIVDTANNREWLRWDQWISYSSAQAAIGAGGALEGFKFAVASDAVLFLQAIKPATTCSLTNDGGCDILNGADDIYDVVGRKFEWDDLADVWFLSGTNRAGILRFYSENAAPPGVEMTINWGSVDDAIAVQTSIGRVAPSWLLYRDVPTTVAGELPLPGTAYLTFAALAAAWGVKRRREHRLRL